MIKRFAVLFLLLCTYAENQKGQDKNFNITYQSIAWKPDGRAIAFTVIKVKPDWSDYSPGKWRLFLYDLINNKPELLDSGCQFASFSPDGRKLAYDKSVDDNSDIFITDLSSRQISKIAGGNAKDRAPTWSGDGKALVFYSDRSGHEELYTSDLSGNAIRQITSNPGIKSFNPVWAPGMDLIVYYAETGNNSDQIFLTDPEGALQVNLTHDEHHNVYPSWTPDGRIIYIREEDKFMIMNRDGSGKREFTDKTGIQVRMSPDGNYLLIAKRDGKLYLLDLSGESEKILFSGSDLFKD